MTDGINIMVSIARPERESKSGRELGRGRRRAKVAALVLLSLAALAMHRKTKTSVDEESLALDSISRAAAVGSGSDDGRDDEAGERPPQRQGGSASRKEQANEMYRNRQWRFRLSDRGGRVDCKIYTAPVESINNGSPVPATVEEFARNADREQYVIHVHGLHHTGTGYLRQTLHDALNKEFSPEGSAKTSASMMDSMRPYRHLLDEAKGNTARKIELYRRYHMAEDEGHHLQSVYPRFVNRIKEMKASKGSVRNAHKMIYMADLCDTADADRDEDRPSNGDGLDERVGSQLMGQWSRYWDMDATFLLQKTPTLDVGFLERTKVLPTLHVMVVRHPMTSNSFGLPPMALLWANAWAHVFELLATDQVEWYAVVAYEALVLDHDKVVRELLEVVRGGMSRHRGGARRNLSPSDGNIDRNMRINKATETVDGDVEELSSRQHGRRRLHYHDGAKKEAPKSPSKYLLPKQKSVEMWKKCVNAPPCRNTLERLTRDVFPYFGYEGNGVPLSALPGPVQVNRSFGRVLFTSEGDRLNEFRRTHSDDPEPGSVDYRPPLELIRKMREGVPPPQNPRRIR